MRFKYSRFGLLIACGLAGVMLAGCAAQRQPLYHWGTFNAQQYSYFKGDKSPEESIQALEKVRLDAKAAGRPLPPGLQAHLAMLYGQTGRTDLFELNLQAERQQFPESAAYIDFLLKNKTNK
jgi:hypothetical protein